MSASVWFEEVNNGLLEEIKNTVSIQDANGILVPLDDKALIVRKPEEDFKSEVFPCISIYSLNYWHDPMRYDSTPLKVGEDDYSNQIFEEQAIPFNLDYQIDFWSKYQIDMDCMTRTWLSKHFRSFNLSVVDTGGNQRFCNCLSKGSIQKSDLVLNGERLFHSVARIQIWVEIDEEVRLIKPVVLDRNIDAKQK